MPDAALLVAITSAAAVALFAVVAWAVILRWRMRPISGWLILLGSLFAGLSTSVMFIVAIRQPLVLISALVLPAFVAVALVRYGRIRAAGILLVGLCLPGFAWWGRFLVEDALDPLLQYDPVLWAWWLPELAGLVMAVGLILMGEVRSADEPVAFKKPEAAVRNPMALGNAIFSAARVGPIDLPNLVSVGGGCLVVFVSMPVLLAVGVPWPIALAVGAAAFALVSTYLFPRAIPPRLREAWEGFASVGHPEMVRWRAETGTEVPTTPRAMARWLRDNRERPETRWARAELLAVVGRLDEAREVAERIDGSSATDRHERAALLAYIDWLAGGDPQLEALAQAAELVGDDGSEERRLARGRVAVARARDLAVTGGDWMAPLIEMRRMTGPIATRWHRADSVRLRIRPSLAIGLAFSALVLLGSGTLLTAAGR